MTGRVREFSRKDTELNRKLVQLEDNVFSLFEESSNAHKLEVVNPVSVSGYIARAGQLVRVVKPVEVLLATPKRSDAGRLLAVWNGSGGAITLRPIKALIGGVEALYIGAGEQVLAYHDGDAWYATFRADPVPVTLFGALGDGKANNDAALARAVAFGSDLYWPRGTYFTTQSIPGLHTVRHRGPGVIKRGTDLFYVEPRTGQTNRLYVATTGSATNDGLSSSQPMLTAAGLFASMVNYGPVLEGTWQGIFAAGTYATLNASFTVPSRSLVTFKGPGVGGTPNVPTFVIDGTGAGASDFGMRASGPGVQVLWQDIKCQNYNNASNGNIGILADYGSDFWTSNVHGASCTGQVLYGEGARIVRLTGGVIDGAKQGILLNACAHVTIGYGHTVATQMVVKNCTQCGVEFSRGSEGHIDLITMESNAVGLDVMHNSRAHLYANAFTSNTVAVRARTGGYYYLDALSGGNVFTTNTENWRNYAGSGESDSDLWLSVSERRRGYSAASFTHTGTVAKTTILSPWTIPQGLFITPTAGASTKKIRVVVHGEFVTAGALSRIGVDFDSVQIDQSVAVAPAASSKFRYEVEIWADGNVAQYKSATLYQNGAAVITNQGSSAQNMAIAARNINITAQLANAGDSLKIDRTEVWAAG